MRGSGNPVWDDVTDATDLAALDPGVPDRWPDAADVVVIGGGAVGLAIGMTCSRAGLHTVVVERSRCASQASGRAAGGLAAGAHPELGPRWESSAKRSLELHRTLDAELGYGLRSLDLNVLPDFVIGDQGHVNPLRMCATFARCVDVLITGVEAAAVDAAGVVRTPNGAIAAKHIVYATGAAPDAARVEHQSYIRGHVIATEPAPFALDAIYASLSDDMLFVQLPSGHIVAGSTREPGRLDEGVDDDCVFEIRGALERIWPETARLGVTNRWTCFRPNIVGDLPVVKRTDERVFVAAGLYSTGILMAPVVGEVVCDAIIGGHDPHAIG
ncbi:MAG: FAD-binding oxidoreductase [Actinomycetota bacterium]